MKIEDLENKFIDMVPLQKMAASLNIHIPEEKLRDPRELKQVLSDADKIISTMLGEVAGELEDLIVRAYLLGIVGLKKLGKSLPEAGRTAFLKTREEEALNYCKTRLEVNLQNATDLTKVKVREILADGINRKLSWRVIAKNLKEDIQEDGDIYRYWEKVAITELHTALNNGQIAATAIGDYLLGVGYPDACQSCKDSIIGKVFKVIEPPKTQFEGLDPLSQQYKDLVNTCENYLWVGKNNYGKVASAKKNTPEGRIERLRHERYFPCPNMHPDCYHRDTEIYTNEGWKKFSELNKKELVATYNLSTDEMEWQKPYAYIQKHYKGKLIRFHSKNIDIAVTPTHNMIFGANNHPLKTIYRLRQAKDWKPTNNWKIPITAKYESPSHIGDIDINGVKFTTSEFAIFMGYYLSEGSYTHRNNRHSWAIKISQHKIDSKQKIYEELKELFVKNKINLRNKNAGILFNDKRLWQYLEQFGRSSDKYIPEIIKEFPKEDIIKFVNAFVLGDGNIREKSSLKNQKNPSISKQIYTSSKRLADDFTEIIIKAGYSLSYHRKHLKGKEMKFKNGTYILNHDIWDISIKTSSYAQMFKKEEIDYNDYIYCVSVPNQTVLIRYNGKVMFCGNCRCRFIGFDPTFTFIDGKGNTIVKTPHNEKLWSEWYQKEIKTTYKL